MYSVIEGSAKDPIDRETLRQVAMYKAIDTGDDEMQTVLVGRRITEDQLKTYIGGNKPI